MFKVNKTIIQCAGAPAPVGTYSQAVVINPSAGRMVWVSGQIGLDPSTGALVGDDFEAQARQVFRNLSAIAEAAGGSLSDVVKLTLFLTDLSEFAKANAIMAEYAWGFEGEYRTDAGVQFPIRFFLFKGTAKLNGATTTQTHGQASLKSSHWGSI